MRQGGAAIASFNDIKVTEISITISEKIEGEAEIRVSDVVVLGSRGGNTMKKKLSIIFLALAAVRDGGVRHCLRRQKTGEKSDYEWKYEKEFTDEHDADMTIDGALNEQRWQGQQYLTHVQDGVTVNYTAVFTEKGLYVGAKAQDPDMKWNARFNFSSTNANPANSAFWFNIKGPDVQDGHAMRAFNFFIDAFDSASRNPDAFRG